MFYKCCFFSKNGIAQGIGQIAPLFTSLGAPQVNLSPGWQRKKSQGQIGALAGSHEVSIISPNGKRFRSIRSKNELKAFIDKTGETPQAQVILSTTATSVIPQTSTTQSSLISTVQVSPKISRNRDRPILTPLYTDNRLPPGWYRKVSRRKNGAIYTRYEVYIFSPTKKRFRSRKELKAFFDKTDETVLQPEHFDFTIDGSSEISLPTEYSDKAKPADTADQEKSFVCVICQKKFPTRFFLQEHNSLHTALWHTGQKPYKCRWQCGMTFAFSKEMRDHEIEGICNNMSDNDNNNK